MPARLVRDASGGDNQGLGRIEFTDDEFRPEERGEIRALLALHRYEAEKRRRRKEKWQSLSLMLAVPAALAAMLVIIERLWALFQLKGR